MNIISHIHNRLAQSTNSSQRSVTIDSSRDRDPPPEDELIPVCDGYSLADAEAVEATKTVNEEWWSETGSAKLEAALKVSPVDKKELADLVDLHRKTVGNHLRGERPPTIDGLEKYEEVLGDGFFHEPKFDIKFTGVADDI